MGQGEGGNDRRGDENRILLRGYVQPRKVSHGLVGHTHVLETHQREPLVDLRGKIELTTFAAVTKPRNPGSTGAEARHQSNAMLSQSFRELRQLKARVLAKKAVNCVLHPHMEALVGDRDVDRRSAQFRDLFERREHGITLLVADTPKAVFKLKRPCNATIVVQHVISRLHPSSIKPNRTRHHMEVQGGSVGMSPRIPRPICEVQPLRCLASDFTQLRGRHSAILFSHRDGQMDKLRCTQIRSQIVHVLKVLFQLRQGYIKRHRSCDTHGSAILAGVTQQYLEETTAMPLEDHGSTSVWTPLDDVGPVRSLLLAMPWRVVWGELMTTWICGVTSAE